MFEIAINENTLYYSDLPTQTFSQRLTKAKLLKGYTQNDLVKLTGLSKSTINELEAGYRDFVTLETLNKLVHILDKNILCDEYQLFILNQNENLKKLFSKYDINYLAGKLNVHRSTIERWRDCKYTIKRKYYLIIKTLI